MIEYREASSKDVRAVAYLHAQNWQHHYRGFLTDHYLDHEVLEDRIRVWQERLSKPPANQLVLLAIDEDQLIGFACIYANHDPEYGAFLDNLHVIPGYQRRGIGRELMRRTAAWVYKQDPKSPYYLWVLAENYQAKGFYEKYGAFLEDPIMGDNPDGSQSKIVRCVWKDINVLL